MHSNSGVLTSEVSPALCPTSSVTCGTGLPSARDHTNNSSFHLQLHHNISSLPSLPLPSTTSLYIPHHMKQPHLLHPVNHHQQYFSPFPLHHPPLLSYDSEFTSSLTVPYQLSHFTPSHLPASIPHPKFHPFR